VESKIKIMSSGKIVLGVLAGVAVGATLGILFAPAKGAATRKMISKKGDDYMDELGEKFNDFISSIEEKFDTVKSGATHLAHDGKLKAEAAMDEVTSAANGKMR
jgi:gas vesicle protein